VFEDQQDIVTKLLAGNEEFRSLYNRHSELKTQVQNAEHGLHPVDGAYLGVLKKEKLHTKDLLAAMIAAYERSA